ncbi:MAG: Acetyl-CoA:oxalate CoA-transferase, partial [Alphaproteobacteria bacterium MarineAlpha1_Bin1]
MREHNLPLKGIKVLDLTHARAGPTAVRQLADWGADAIKIEVPVEKDSGQGLGGARHGPDFLNLHRNKRAMTLNLKKPQGLEIFLTLAKDADVIVENFRAEVKHRLGVDYESVRKVNSRIIYGSISGFGQSGPISKRAGVDQIAQGMGGLMSITGLPGQGPVRVGIPIADLTAGMYLAQGILLALIERNQSGEGQWVHTSLLEAQISMLDFQAARWLIDEDVPGQAGNDHPTNIPMGAFKTADGAVNIAASSSRLWTRFLEVA